MKLTGAGTILKQVMDIIEPVASEEDLDLVDVKLHTIKKGTLLKVIIDKPGGVTIDDCQSLSKRLNYLLDVEDVPLTSYRLEVSSPGIFCELTKSSDFTRNIGKRTLIQYTDQDGRSITLHGILDGYSEESLILQIESGQTITIDKTRLLKARLDPLLFPNARSKAKVKRGKKWAGK